MNWGGWLLWGFVGTVVLTIAMATSQGMRFTRINLPYMVGTMFTPSRDRAKALGFGLHLLNGWVFALIYVTAFNSWGRSSWWLGALTGLVHGLFVLTVGMRFMPGIHPRMASEHHGPTVVRQLEPPGFMALNYGVQTPLSVIGAHVLFGVILGAFYIVPATGLAH
jgi:uncharacterized membrane protein YagU involved in acid resistance